MSTSIKLKALEEIKDGWNDTRNFFFTKLKEIRGRRGKTFATERDALFEKLRYCDAQYSSARHAYQNEKRIEIARGNLRRTEEDYFWEAIT
jgi:hypothetical protein